MVAGASLNVNYEYEGITITGVVGKPEIARSNRANQIFFVNNRYVKDRILSNATEKAFKGMIPIGRFGFLVLNLEMSPSLVDCNVHPAKLEVRFQEEQKVFKAVYCAIQDTLLKSELVANSNVSEVSEKNNMEGEEMEGQETKSSLSGLFRKIAKNSDDEEMTLIESIYKSKNGGRDIEDEYDTKIDMNQENIDETNEEEKIESKNIILNTMPYVAPETKNIEEMVNTSNASNIETSSEEAIKNTINEFMQMGKGLTAEQIREKLSKIAAMQSNKSTQNVENKENVINDSEKIENTKDNANLNSANYEMNNYQRVSDNTQQSTKKDIFEETFSNFTLVPPKQTIKEQAKQNTINMNGEYTSTPLNNNVLENSEKYETQTISTKEIEKLANNNIKNDESQLETEGQKPGDILLSILQERDRKELIPGTPSGEFSNMYAQIFGSETSEVKEKEKVEEERNNANDIINSNMNIFEEEEEYKGKIPYKFIGIAFKTYIILEIQNELYILDQHAAHERIMYEKVKQNYYSDEDKDSQLMLLPDIITLTHKEMDIARENMEKFEKAGFVLEEFGDNTIKLTGVPNICLDLDTKELFLETLDEINTVARTAKQEIEERFIATIACKAAVKANMALTKEEVESLLDNLLKLPNPFTCPHGRPTAIKLSKTDIEKKFARRK